MTCSAPVMTFRLLDAYVGWDPDAHSPQSLTGLDDPTGIRLVLLDPGGASPSAVNPYLPPALLAPGCTPCKWFLAAPSLVRWKLLHFDPCVDCWEELRMGGFAQSGYEPIVGLAFHKYRLAVAQATGWTRVYALADARVLFELPVAGPVAFSLDGDLFVARVHNDKTTVLQFDRSGRFVAPVVRDLPGRSDRIGVGKDGAVWLVLATPHSAFQLVHITGGVAVPGTIAELAAQFDRTGLLFAGPEGFCIEWNSSSAGAGKKCANWRGECLADLAPPATPLYEKKGQLLTLAIDSGIPGCRWHRVQVDADVPAGTSAVVSIATSYDAAPTAQGDPALEPGWDRFDAGVPHHDDWETPQRSGAADYLVNTQPPGRYLFLRLRLSGDGLATPVVRRIELDFERSTSLDYLPAVYRENPEAEDFSERFLAIFDSLLQRLDDSIRYAPALLDSDHVPEGLLPWVASFFDLKFEYEWTTDQRRRILKALPALFRRRGTPAALLQTLQLVFGVDAVIEELPFERTWSALGSGLPLGEARLFGRAEARLRLGGSPLGEAPLKNLGDPALDAVATHAFKFRVRLPPSGPFGMIKPEAAQKVIEAQKPAHTLLAGTGVAISRGFVLGSEVAVGIDTAFSTLPPPQLGENARLSRQTILWHPANGSGPGFALTGEAAVGLSTQL